MINERNKIKMICRSCPVCGSSDENEIFAEADFDFETLDGFAFASRKIPEYMHYRLIECPTCDLLYANPLPDLDFIKRGYIDALYNSGTEAHHAAVTYAELLARVVKIPDHHGALDIGAGDGAFLEQLVNMGFDGVIGIEPSRASVLAASDHIRPMIRETVFRCADFEPLSFSLITCFQTLEHIHNPLEVVCEVKTLLKPGGAAFFISHDRRAFITRLIGRKSPIFDIEHLQLFSSGSFRYLMEKVGFKNCQVIKFVNRYPLRYWLLLMPLSVGIKRSIIRLLDNYRFAHLPISMPVGNMAIIAYNTD